MNLTQLVCFEVTPYCNRGAEHALCPNAHPDRWLHSAGQRRMTNAQIVDVCHAMYGGGFDGWTAFHHYNEPLLAWPRIRNLIANIRVCVPAARFLLWTNGDLLPADLEELAVFGKIVVSNYAGRDLSALHRACRDVTVLPGNLDWRLNPPRTGLDPEPHCLRPFLEIVFDYFGNVRTCCYDWRNETGIGNLHDTPFVELWQRWVTLRAALAAQPMQPTAPNRCLTCGTRYTQLAHYAPEVAARTLEFLGGS